MSVAHTTQRLLLVLTISILQKSRVSHCFLIHSPRVLLASYFIFLGRGLPFVGGTDNLARCILTKVSKSWVYNDQQLFERWWIHGFVVAMVIGIVNPVFYIVNLIFCM
jgi:hypothetical protein